MINKQTNDRIFLKPLPHEGQMHGGQTLLPVLWVDGDHECRWHHRRGNHGQTIEVPVPVVGALDGRLARDHVAWHCSDCTLLSARHVVQVIGSPAVCLGLFDLVSLFKSERIAGKSECPSCLSPRVEGASVEVIMLMMYVTISLRLITFHLQRLCKWISDPLFLWVFPLMPALMCAVFMMSYYVL